MSVTSRAPFGSHLKASLGFPKLPEMSFLRQALGEGCVFIPVP